MDAAEVRSASQLSSWLLLLELVDLLNFKRMMFHWVVGGLVAILDCIFPNILGFDDHPN